MILIVIVNTKNDVNAKHDMNVKDGNVSVKNVDVTMMNVNAGKMSDMNVKCAADTTRVSANGTNVKKENGAVMMMQSVKLPPF
jgi:hypothetical protein